MHGRHLGRLEYDVVMVELMKEGADEGSELVMVTSRGCQAEKGKTAADPIKVFISYWAGSRQMDSNHVAAGIRKNEGRVDQEGVFPRFDSRSNGQWDQVLA